jgi:hypothetical protein
MVSLKKFFLKGIENTAGGDEQLKFEEIESIHQNFGDLKK